MNKFFTFAVLLGLVFFASARSSNWRNLGHHSTSTSSSMSTSTSVSVGVGTAAVQLNQCSVSVGAGAPVAANDTDFMSFDSVLTTFYNAVIAGTCASLPNCQPAQAVLDFVSANSQFQSYAATTSQDSCSGTGSFCQESITSQSGVSDVQESFLWATGQNAKNAYIYQNCNNMNISGSCYDNIYCQNIFIFQNCSNVNVSVYCTGVGVCDNIVVAMNSDTINDNIICSNLTDCQENIFKIVNSSNANQNVLCGDQAVCGNDATGSVTNFTQIQYCQDQSVCQYIFNFENSSNILQNNTCTSSSTCQVIDTCTTGCTNAVANNLCDVGTICTNANNISS